MGFLAVLVALVLEQVKPLPRESAMHEALRAYVAWCGRNFDAGRPHHAWVAWCAAVLVPAALVALVYELLHRQHALAGLAFDIVVLYVALGFRQFSHYFTDIRNALERGDENEARRLLAEWRHLDTRELPRTEVLRHVVEHALLAAHRHVFGVFFWFVALSAVGLGPLGAVVYRLAEFCSRYWGFRQRAMDAPVNEALLKLSRLLFSLIDHVPVRLTAFGFAVVGDFEAAVAGWRRDATLWQHPNEGIILAAAAGAVGVQLGGAAPPGVTPDRRKTFTAGGEPDLAAAVGSTPGVQPQLGHLASVVGLVWRSVVLWLVLVALLTAANVIG
ncbi:MAG: CobD/CbiB family protein [Betaproteobacteria bacterium]|nr:CobD/CbiB family protein [Betaproteobacteria bacterium]MCC6248232.1 CobD/CbiB family protein [Rubrivivax sp.]MCL4697207.1 CobD/CbiB family protein [Burkholderiaceae bacterium]